MQIQITKRWHGLDLIRLICFIAIVGQHFGNAVWDSNHYPFIYFLPWQVITSYARVFSISGLIVAFLFSALTGFHGKSYYQLIKPFRLMLWGWLTYLAYSYLFWQRDLFWIWHVFPLLYLGIASAQIFCRIHPTRAMGLVAFSGVLLCIPFWEIQTLSNLPLQWSHALVGNCEKFYADWPILPWIGLIWAGYGCGVMVRFAQSLEIRKNEIFAWAGVLGCTIPFLGAYYQIPVGSEFACYLYRRPPWVFFIHFAWPLFLMRVSLSPRVQQFLERSASVQTVSSLCVSQQFGLAYFVHYILLRGVSVFLTEKVHDSPWMTFLLFLTILPMTEGILRIVNYLLRSIQAEAQRPPAESLNPAIPSRL